MKRLVPFHTLRGRLTLLACLATLPAFLFVVYVASNERVAALRRAETESIYVADLASREHALHVLGAHRLLDRLASLSASEQGDALGDLPKLLPTILHGFPQFANLGVVELDGTIAYSVVPSPRQINMTRIPAFQRALNSQEVTVSSYLVGLIVERPILIMAKALRNAKGHSPLVLFAALDLAWLDRLAKQAGLPPESALLIVDRDGTILASSLDHEGEHAANQRLKGFKELIQHPETLTRCEAPDGIPRLAVAVPLKGMRDVWVVAGPPEASVLSRVNSIFYRDLAVLALLTLFAIASSLVATDLSVLRDLRLLAGATRRFGKGELKTRAPVPRPHGEIRDLTMAFNSMADTLELRDSQAVQAQESLRALSHRLQTVREEEAARIAQELHDELGQELSVLRLELERLYHKVATGSTLAQPEHIAAVIEKLGERVDVAVRSVRRISSELRPGVLDCLGLVAGLEWLLHEFESRTGIGAVLAAEGVEQKVDAEISTALFRITQEALTNVVRHSGATFVTAQLSGDGRDLVLQVKDNGRGFDPGVEPDKPSLGLLGMRERAARLGGTLRIVSAPGKGTELHVAIPRDAGVRLEEKQGNDEDTFDR